MYVWITRPIACCMGNGWLITRQLTVHAVINHYNWSRRKSILWQLIKQTFNTCHSNVCHLITCSSLNLDHIVGLIYVVTWISVVNSCKWCCRDKNDVNKTCQPYGNNSLPNGMPCVQGFCHEVLLFPSNEHALCCWHRGFFYFSRNEYFSRS